MAFEFAPLSDEELDGIARFGVAIKSDQRSMARELLALRAAVREWHSAADMGDLARILPAEASLRALVKGK